MTTNRIRFAGQAPLPARAAVRYNGRQVTHDDGRPILPDDELTLYHETSAERAEHLRQHGTLQDKPVGARTVDSDYEPGRGMGRGLYLMHTPHAAGGVFGDTVLPVRVRAVDLAVPPERAHRIPHGMTPLRSLMVGDGYTETPLPHHAFGELIRRQASRPGDRSVSTITASQFTAVLIDNYKHDPETTWFHGTQAHFDQFDDKRRPARKKKDDWNTGLGHHFTSEHAVARQFAGSQGRVIPAKLNIHNPKVYSSEDDMTYEVAAHEHARGNTYDKHGYVEQEFHPDENGEDKNYDYDRDDSERVDSDFRNYPDAHPYDYSASEINGWIRHHPDRQGIVDRFKHRLREQGHDGIVYGNEHEHPEQDMVRHLDPETGIVHLRDAPRHASAIAFGAKQIKIQKQAARRFTPDKRIFTHTDGLDHRLFDGERLRPEVRSYILGTITSWWADEYRDWSKWAKIFFAGSEASEWSSPTLEGNGDLDILVGVDYDGCRAANPQLAGLTDQQITDRMNAGFRAHNGPVTLTVDGIQYGPFDRTTFVNAASYDIRRIRPYAAYDVGADEWVVKPPHLPHWSLSELPKPVQQVLRAADSYARHVLKLPEPERTQQGAALFEAWHSDRSRAFSERGEGWWDIANLREKFGDQAGWWAQLVDCAHRAKQGLDAAPADWSNIPTGYLVTARILGVSSLALFDPKHIGMFGDDQTIHHHELQFANPDASPRELKLHPDDPNYWRSEQWVGAQRRVLSPDHELHTTQEWWHSFANKDVHGSGTDGSYHLKHPTDYSKSVDDDLPTVARVNGKDWIGHGHHRLMADRRLRRPTTVLYRDLDAERGRREAKDSEAGAYPSRVSHHELERLVPGYDPEEHAFSDPSLRRATFSYVHRFPVRSLPETEPTSPEFYAHSVDHDSEQERQDHLEEMRELGDAIKQNPHSVPPIIVDHTRGFPLLDGSHRSGLALHHGVEHLPAYVRDGGRERTTAAQSSIARTTWYHGTRADLQSGDHVLPGYPTYNGRQNDDAIGRAFFTSDLSTAHAWAFSRGDRAKAPRIYQVEPTGRFEVDPGGNASVDRRTRHPLRVVKEVPFDPEFHQARYDGSGHTAKLPKTQKCDYCEQQATKRVIWAEGMGYIPVCDEHEQRAIDHVGDDYCNTRPIAKTAGAGSPDHRQGYEHGLVGARGNLPFIERTQARGHELEPEDHDYLAGHAAGTQEKQRRDQHRAETGEYKCQQCAGTGMGRWRGTSTCNECQGSGSISQEAAHKTDTLYHVTDNPHFTPNAHHVPEDNTVAIENRSRPGLYAAHKDDVEHWTRGEGYVRPYVAEIHVPHYAHEPGRWGGERFIPAEHFDKVKVGRVIPLSAHGTNYRGPDARDMTPEQHAVHKQHALDTLRDEHDFGPEDIDHLRRAWAAASSTMYHWAPQDARDDIAQHGLDHTRAPDFNPAKQGPHGVFLHHNEATARDWVPDIERTHDLYAVDTRGLSLRPDPYDTGDASYTERPVPPDRLRRLVRTPSIVAAVSGHMKRQAAGYGYEHRPPGPPRSEDYYDGGQPAHDLDFGRTGTSMYGDGSMPGSRYRVRTLQDHPDTGVQSALRAARGNPDHPITMYRALPHEHVAGGFHTGDWVTLSKSYAQSHARNNGGWPVIKATVPARHLWTNGDYNEWGYHGPDVQGEIHTRGRQATRAVTSMMEAPREGPLPHSPGRLFYRVHPMKRGWSQDNASSQPFGGGGPYGDEGEELPREHGYSAFDNPHDLERYLNAMDWHRHLPRLPRTREDCEEGRQARVDPHKTRVVQFPGEIVGQGHDGEHLVRPHARADRQEMDYETFQHRLRQTPHPDVAYHWHKSPYEQVPEWAEGNGHDCDPGGQGSCHNDYSEEAHEMGMQPTHHWASKEASAQLWITPQLVMGSAAGLNHARQVNSASEAVTAVQQGLTAVLPPGAWFPVRQVLLGLGMSLLDVTQRLKQFGAPSSVTG